MLYDQILPCDLDDRLVAAICLFSQAAVAADTPEEMMDIEPG